MRILCAGKDYPLTHCPTPVFDPLTLLQTELAEQRKQVSEIMAQNAKLMATLSKGGGGGGGSSGGGSRGGSGGSGGSNNDDRNLTPWKEEKLSPNCNKTVVHKLADCFSLKANKNKHPAGWGVKWGE